MVRLFLPSLPPPLLVLQVSGSPSQDSPLLRSYQPNSHTVTAATQSVPPLHHQYRSKFSFRLNKNKVGVDEAERYRSNNVRGEHHNKMIR